MIKYWCAVWQTFLTCFWLNAEDRKLVLGPFMILSKWHYSEIWLFLNSWHLPFLNVPYSHLQKKKTLESWHNWLLSNWFRLLNWKRPGIKPQFYKVFKWFLKKIVLSYFYQLAKFGDLNKMSFKIYIQKCTLSHVLIPIMTSHIW